MYRAFFKTNSKLQNVYLEMLIKLSFEPHRQLFQKTESFENYRNKCPKNLKKNHRITFKKRKVLKSIQYFFLNTYNFFFENGQANFSKNCKL